MKWLRRPFAKPKPETTSVARQVDFARAVARHEVKSVDDLWDFIGYVVLRAPDRFPREDYLADEEQMTLEVAFEVMRRAISVAYPEPGAEDKRSWLADALSRSLTAYRQGDTPGGAHILQDDFQDQIFKAH